MKFWSSRILHYDFSFQEKKAGNYSNAFSKRITAWRQTVAINRWKITKISKLLCKGQTLKTICKNQEYRKQSLLGNIFKVIAFDLWVCKGYLVMIFYLWDPQTYQAIWSSLKMDFLSIWFNCIYYPNVFAN